MTDQFTPYETGLVELLRRLGEQHPAYLQALTFEQRLTENIAAARTHGDVDNLCHERSHIVQGLNNIAQNALGVSFNDLCPGLPPPRPSPVEVYLDAVRDYCASLPYLTLQGIRAPETPGEVYVSPRLSPLLRQDKRHALWGARRGEPVSIAEMMQDRTHAHVLVLGEPGTGKSTLLRQMAACAWDAPERVGLDAPYLPILVPLRRLAPADDSIEGLLNRALTGELVMPQKLPEGFFTDWPAQTGAAWLILLDGLDEAPADERPRLVQWFRGMLRHTGQHRIVISSRPSGYTRGELDGQQLGHYALLPFTPEQTAEFVHKWLGDEAEGFREELGRVGVGELRGTPLLLLIAAKVYLDRNSLPERRSALYEQFVDIWLGEAGQRGLKTELGERVYKVAKFALARLALAMVERPFEVSETLLNEAAAAYLHDALSLSADEAAVDGTAFVRVMSRRSGVFVRPSDVYGFVHPTFREYLAAFALVRAWNRDLSQAGTFLQDHWQDDAWREVLFFALSLLSDRATDVGDLLEPLLRHEWAGVRFAGQALAEGIRVSREVSDRIVDRLLESARAEPWDSRAISILGRLRDNARAADGLLVLAQDGAAPGNLRLEASQSLGRLNREDKAVSVLLDLLDPYYSDDSFLNEEMNWTVETLMKWGYLGEAVLSVLVLARSPYIQASHDLYGMDEEAWWALDVLSEGDETARALQAVGGDEAVDAEVRLLAAVSLERMGWSDEAASVLSRLARGAMVDAKVRVGAAERLSEGEATMIHLAMVCDTALEADARLLSADGLGELVYPNEVNWEDEVLAAIADESVPARVRVESARELEQLCRLDDARLAYLALVCDTALDQDVRLEAADALSRLGRAPRFSEPGTETTSILLALAGNAAVHPAVRLDAAKSLRKLDRVDEAVSILLALADDATVDAWMRQDVVQALHDLGYDERV